MNTIYKILVVTYKFHDFTCRGKLIEMYLSIVENAKSKPLRKKPAFRKKTLGSLTHKLEVEIGIFTYLENIEATSKQ